MNHVGIIDEGAKWLHYHLCMYAERIIRDGMVWLSDLKSDMWLILYMKTV